LIFRNLIFKLPLHKIIRQSSTRLKLSKHITMSRLIRKILFFFFLGIGFVTDLQAQDYIYTVDNSILEGEVISIKSSKIKYKRQKNQRGPTFKIDRDKVLMLFNRKGNYLVISDLADNKGQADEMIDAFMASVEDSVYHPYDKIITKNNDIIPAEILGEDEKNMKYRTAEGKKATIELADVFVVLRQDGSHKLWAYTAIASTTLSKVRTKINSFGDRLISVQTTNAGKPNEEKKVTSSKAIDAKKNDEPDELNEIDFQLYSRKALEKTQELSRYFQIISGKSTDFETSNKAIDLAVALFINEDAAVEVGDVKSVEKKKYKIRKYLENLKRLKYDRVEINWTNVQYVSNLRKGTDGNYYGIVSFQQEFKGFIDGKMVYRNVTTKNMEVILKTYTKQIEGTAMLLWDIFLSDIGVTNNKTS
jgi:hypothetical protein